MPGNEPPTAAGSPAARAAGGWIRGSLRPAAGGAAGRGRAEPAWLIVKIGGSLLSRPRWPALLATLVGAVRRRPCRIVVGGGAVVDGLRAIDRAAPQPEPLVHELAIEAMRLTARLVSAALDLPLVTGMEATAGPAVLDVPAWLANAAAPAWLPAGWGVTSDSIAACVAAEHGGGLLLVKSAPPPACASGDPVAAVAAAGWVDACFPRAAAGLVEIGWAAPETS